MKRHLLPFCILLFSIVVAAKQNLPHPDQLPDNPYASYFEKAYSEHPSIPKGVLEAVAFTNTRFAHITLADPASCTGMPRVFGVMGLVADGKNYFQNTLHTVSSLSRFTPEEIMASPEKNILAYADAYEQAQKYLLADSKIENQVPVLVFLSELPDNGDLQNNFAMNTHLYSVFSFLNDKKYAAKYRFPEYSIDLPEIFGAENFNVLSSSSVKIEHEKIMDKNGNEYQYDNSKSHFSVFSPDYAPALYDPAASCNYSGGRSQAISAVTIHTVQGGYAGCISWFKNCAASVSAHYVVRSSDGQITQMVLEANTAWHVGSQNGYTIGIEHEGFVNDASWYTTAMYTQSAALCADICASGYGIPPLRTGFQPWMATTNYNSASIPGTCTKIKGHQHYPGQSHTDPGPNWNWDYFYKLINPQPAATVYTATTGTVYDSGGAGGNYSDDERLVWTISPTGATSVTLTFNSFDTENTWDYLYVYDGTDVWAPLIGYYTGTSNPGTLVANSGNMTLEFRSDCATPAAGWNASWTSNATTITPANLSVAGVGCPSLGVNLNWQNSGAGWYIDVSDDPNYSYYWNKAVSNITTIGCPGGFEHNTVVGNFLAFQPGTTYYWRIWDGTSHTNGSPFTTPVCTYMDTTCAGTFDDTGGPSAAYSGNEDWTNIIQPTASSVTMVFTSFDLELNFDTLWIYDGLPNTTLIGSFTGTTSPGTVTANSGTMSLRFKADPFVNNAGWTATWSCVSAVGINEQNNNNAVVIYPNPSNGEFNVESSTLKVESIVIINVLGEKVYSNLKPQASNNIDLRSQPKGIYFYTIADGSQTIVTGKLIIE